MDALLWQDFGGSHIKVYLIQGNSVSPFTVRTTAGFFACYHGFWGQKRRHKVLKHLSHSIVGLTVAKILLLLDSQSNSMNLT